MFNDPNIYFGIYSFDNLYTSLMTVNQIVSTDVMYTYLSNLADADSPIFASIYCIVICVVGTFFLMNLILAVIIQAFINIQKKEVDEQLKQLDKE